MHPDISLEAGELLVQAYKEMRQQGLRGGRKVITATTRQLESLIRLSEAHARMRLQSTVDAEDVAEAVRLINVATQRAAMDPRTGTINMDLIATGHTCVGRAAAAAADARAAGRAHASHALTLAAAQCAFCRCPPRPTNAATASGTQ